MRFDVAIFGELHFGRGKARAWYGLEVDSRAYKSIARVFPKKTHLPPATVADLMIELPPASVHGLFLIEEEGRHVHVRGLFADSAFVDRCRQLAAFFMVAAEVGAKGHVCFLGQGAAVGYGISLDGKEAELIALSDEEMANAAHDPALDVVSDHFRAVEPAGPSVARLAAEAARTRESSEPRRELLRLPTRRGA